MADARLLTGLLCWNRRAEENNLGATKFGHYALELIDRLQDHERRLHGVVPFPDWVHTPDLDDDELEEFGTGRQLTSDLHLSTTAVSGATAHPADDDDVEGVAAGDAAAALLQLDELPGVSARDVLREAHARHDVSASAGAGWSALQTPATGSAATVSPLQTGAASSHAAAGDNAEATCPPVCAPPRGAPAPGGMLLNVALDGSSQQVAALRARHKPAGVSTIRHTSAAYLRRTQSLPRDVRPLGATDAGLQLFLDLLPQMLPRPGDRRKSIDYNQATALYNKEVLERPASAGLHLVAKGWMKDFCESFTKRYNTQRAISPVLDELKALWRELKTSAAQEQWSAGTASRPEQPLEEDASALCGTILPFMPLTLGAPLPGLHAHDATPRVVTDDDVLDEAYNAVCARHPTILDPMQQFPVADVTRELAEWLRARGHDDLLGRVSKDHVKGRLRTRRKQAQAHAGGR